MRIEAMGGLSHEQRDSLDEMRFRYATIAERNEVQCDADAQSVTEGVTFDNTAAKVYSKSLTNPQLK